MKTMNKKTVSRPKGATKHCCWATYNADSRYPERLSDGTTFIRFPKPGCIKPNISEWEKQRENETTEKAKRLQHSCGRKDFYSLDQIKKDTYICTQHFIGRKRPTAENPDLITATLTELQVDSLVARSLKRQNSKSRKRNAMPELEMAPAKRKINCESVEESVVLLDENPQDSGSRHDSEIEAEEEGSSPSHCHKETQTVYSKYELGAKVENMVLRNEMKIFGSLP